MDFEMMLPESQVYWPMGLLLLTLTLFLVIYLQLSNKKNSLEPPVVPFAWPLVGHIPQMAIDPHSFLLRCYKKYGKVFTIRIGRKKLTYVCDRDLLPEFLAADEGKLSFYNVIQDLYMTRSFSDTINNVISALKPFIRHLVHSRVSEFVGIMNDNMALQAEIFKQKCLDEGKGGPVVKVLDELVEEVCHPAIFKSTFSFELSPEIKEVSSKFFMAVNKSIYASFFLPKKAMDLLILPKVRRLRNDCTAIFKPMLKKHFEDSTLCTSRIMRMAADFDLKIEGRESYALDDVSEVLAVMHFTLTTTPLGLCVHAIKELAARPDLWKQIRSELSPSTTSTETILKNTTLHACVMEAGRVNSHLLALQRATHPTSYLGPYYVGNSDMVSIPGKLLFESELAEVNYLDAGKYYPERFMRGAESDSLEVRSFWLWGGGRHVCPGRNISIAIAKLSLLQIIHRFDVELKFTAEKDYGGLAAFPTQVVHLSLTPVMAVTLPTSNVNQDGEETP